MSQTETAKKYKLLIDGEWVDSDETLEVYDKFSNHLVGLVPKANQKLVDQAISAAYRAFELADWSPYDRFQVLNKVSELLLEQKTELAKTITKEVGKPYKQSLVEVERTAQTFEISAEEAKRIHGEVVPIASSPGAENRMAFTIRAPYGVVCAITPFNVPLNLVAHKIGPALAAGNTVVLKPTSMTPMIALELGKILEDAGVPKGFVNIVVGSGSTVGKWLVQDERISVYTFTGSASVGKMIKEESGLRKTLLELGSNSAVIVHEDADIDLAVNMCVPKSFDNAGQVCISVQRIYVHQKIYDEFLSKFIELTKGLKIGNPFDETIDIGPMISESEAERAERWVNEAVDEGAKIIYGGTREGALFKPTVLTDVKESMKVSCEELFAPVVGMNKYEDLDECIVQVNRSKYGLQAGIFTTNIDTAFQAAQKIHVGGVMINDASQFRADQMPYGGVKESGAAKEGPKYAIDEMTEERIIVLNL